MARSTFRTYLMEKETNAWAKLVDIKNYPDLGGAPQSIDTTTLSDDTETSIPGVKQLGDGLQFLANYDKANYTKLKALENIEKDYAVWLGGTGTSTTDANPTGDEGIWEFKGRLSVYVNGGGVNEVTNMTIVIMPSTAIKSVSQPTT